jgi:hypothetical protein
MTPEQFEALQRAYKELEAAHKECDLPDKHHNDDLGPVLERLKEAYEGFWKAAKPLAQVPGPGEHNQ